MFSGVDVAPCVLADDGGAGTVDVTGEVDGITDVDIARNVEVHDGKDNNVKSDDGAADQTVLMAATMTLRAISKFTAARTTVLK